jgi:hypothetical protein
MSWLKLLSLQLLAGVTVVAGAVLLGLVSGEALPDLDVEEVT